MGICSLVRGGPRIGMTDFNTEQGGKRLFLIAERPNQHVSLMSRRNVLYVQPGLCTYKNKNLGCLENLENMSISV